MKSDSPECQETVGERTAPEPRFQGVTRLTVATANSSTARGSQTFQEADEPTWRCLKNHSIGALTQGLIFHGHIL